MLSPLASDLDALFAPEAAGQRHSPGRDQGVLLTGVDYTVSFLANLFKR